MGSAVQSEQRRNLGQCALDHQRGLGTICPHWHRGQQGDQDLLPGGQDQQHRAGRSPHGHHSAGDHLRDWRRDPGRQKVQGRADRGAVGGLHPGESARSAGGFRRTDQGRFDDGLRRDDRHGRSHLYGGHRPLFPELFAGGILRQMCPLPGRDRREPGDPEQDMRRRGPAGRHRAVRGAVRDLAGLFPVWSGHNRLQPCPIHHPLLPGRV